MLETSTGELLGMGWGGGWSNMVGPHPEGTPSSAGFKKGRDFTS